MHAYQKPIVTVAVHAVQQVILAVHRRVGFGVLFPVMHAFESILNMTLCTDPAIQDGLQGSHLLAPNSIGSACTSLLCASLRHVQRRILS